MGLPCGVGRGAREETIYAWGLRAGIPNPPFHTLSELFFLLSCLSMNLNHFVVHLGLFVSLMDKLLTHLGEEADNTLDRALVCNRRQF